MPGSHSSFTNLQPGPYPFHKFHGFSPKRHILSLGLRDPNDPQVLHANGNDYVVAHSVRGSKKVTPSSYRSFAASLRPDILFSLPDIPYTPVPHSQKRVTKSIERSLLWLTDQLIDHISRDVAPPAIFVHLLGGLVSEARSAFANGLLEPLKEKPHIHQGVFGYVLDLLPIRHSLSSGPSEPLPLPIVTSLLHASLDPLPQTKPRLLTGSSSPHEILHHILHSGVDLFDSAWAQRAADWGIALDFCFPVLRQDITKGQAITARPVAHNLYDELYATDFKRLAVDLLGSAELKHDSAGEDNEKRICPCTACSPTFSSSLQLSMIPETRCGMSRHHRSPVGISTICWHTHEMSAHALLVSHNLSVLDAFFAGVREVLSAPNGEELFALEVNNFSRVYLDTLLGSDGVMEQGKASWKKVDLARGKAVSSERGKKFNGAEDCLVQA
ncbi:hypothetical protein BS47DRAFT_1377465 [Hydnum rufescens UP504]|uniref:tRNA-guanine(15) transglycosylase-like domain-containing protein n=1 Tax=Hydnum rufescens UP504 TaxID=1448309 RepID=A0A9P6AQS8_9AGAM|nr:hypothetical protein BS47DRAFT_1377465 [Hydnum rufescens UP504]